jgi:cytochrome b subunit of formate dehydrogenase
MYANESSYSVRRLAAAAFATAVLAAWLVAGAAAQSNEDCMDCHADADLVTLSEDGTELSLRVDLAVYEESVHGDFDCVDCHGDAAELPHESPLAAVFCGDCHPDSEEEYTQSLHALARQEGNPLSPNCASCHGKHAIVSPATASSTSPRQDVETCETCHARQEVKDSFLRKAFAPVADYEASVHAKALHQDPDAKAATCVTCHGAHAVTPPGNPLSTISKHTIPETCGQCHEKEKAEYQESIHYKAVQRGYYESPVCNDCHSEHRILSPSEDEALTHPTLVSSQLCASCHANRTLMASFGLDPSRFDTYSKTYHGLAVLRGSPDAANCVSCHGMHAIQGSTDELSATHPSNLRETCGECHGEVDDTFASIAVHPSNQRERNPVAYFVRILYLWLIPLTIGGMVVHNLVIHSYFIRRRWSEYAASPQVRRFQRFEIGQHLLLITSFALLVVTGFALKHPDAGWVGLLSTIGLTEGLRSTLHRIAGVVLVAISLVQLGYLVADRRGRRDVKALLPAVQDLRDFGRNMAHHLGRGAERPRFGRFDYMEKAEYLALIWGTAVMAVTGFVLWFPEASLGLLPVWAFETSEVIHYYEAWLATLSIVVWHWYFVVFHPARYPIAFTWLTGTVTEAEQAHHHPLEEKSDEDA